MDYDIRKEILDINNCISCSLYINGISNLISICSLTLEDSEWTISKWSTITQYQHSGCGKLAMQELLKYCLGKYGIPKSVKYIWNGKNEYVGEWLRKFDAVCSCPLSVMKNNADDDWESHIYQLTVEKVLQYFELK